MEFLGFPVDPKSNAELNYDFSPFPKVYVRFLREVASAGLTNTNDIREEIKRRINMGNACYYSLEKILSSHLLSKKLKVNILAYKTIMLPVVLYGCETWSLTLREENRLKVFDNEVLRKIFGVKRY